MNALDFSDDAGRDVAIDVMINKGSKYIVGLSDSTRQKIEDILLSSDQYSSRNNLVYLVQSDPDRSDIPAITKRVCDGGRTVDMVDLANTVPDIDANKMLSDISNLSDAVSFAINVKRVELEPIVDKLVTARVTSVVANLAYDLARHRIDDLTGEQLNVLENIVITSKQALTMADFAILPGANVQLIQDTLVKSALDGTIRGVGSDGMAIARLAASMPGVDIERMQRTIVAAGSANALASFAAYVPGSDILTLRRAQEERFGDTRDFDKTVKLHKSDEFVAMMKAKSKKKPTKKPE